MQQGELGLFFVFRSYSIKGEVSLLFGLRFSFFDIRIRAEYRILTYCKIATQSCSDINEFIKLFP